MGRLLAMVCIVCECIGALLMLSTTGSCQFPTLGFVVDRYKKIKSFVSEPFWSIKVIHKRDDINVNFSWDRSSLFDRMAVMIMYERCLTAKVANVVSVVKKPTSKW